jgi:superfamily II DNA or RNA helicase
MKFELTSHSVMTNISFATCKEAIRHHLTIRNPAFTEAERNGQSTDSIPEYLKFYEETQGGLIGPRGVFRALCNIFYQHGEKINGIDMRPVLDPVDFTFNDTLRPYQQDVVTRILGRLSHCIVVGPEGCGKICMGLKIIAQRKQRALIICHTIERLNQWVVAIENILGIPASEVGVIGGEKSPFLGEKITVALDESLYPCSDDVTPYIGQLIVDECNCVTSRTLTETVNAFPAKFRLGLTTNPFRDDGLEKIMEWYVGPITGQIDEQTMLDDGNLCQGEAVFIPTGFESIHRDELSLYYSDAIYDLTHDLKRNKLICSTVKKYHSTGISLVLSDLRGHCDLLAGILKDEHGINAALLTGKTPARERKQIIQDLQTGKCRFLVATNQLMAKGFDMPGISTLAMTTPVKFSFRLMQYIRLVLRPAPGKIKGVILNFSDHDVFQNSTRSRWRTYLQQGIQVTGSL